MSRQRVLLLELDGVLESVLCDMFADEGMDVSVCTSLAELHARRFEVHGALSDDTKQFMTGVGATIFEPAVGLTC